MHKLLYNEICRQTATLSFPAKRWVIVISDAAVYWQISLGRVKSWLMWLPRKKNGTGRLFFRTVFPAQLQIFCAWQEKAPLNRTGSGWMPYIPLFLYSFRWNIEVSYYEQKSFWSLCAYMVRSRKGVEMLVNLINISYCAMKLLPYMEETLSQYRGGSVQEFRFALSEQVKRQIFYVNLVQNIENHIKSTALIKALQRLCLRETA